MIRTRFAPSPTGYLHIGGLRTALYNYLYAKKHNGTFILRIEDTDQKRFVEGAHEHLIEMMKWAGLTYQEGPDKDGDYAPYVQSKRTKTYQKYAHMLLEKKAAYRCFCTAERLEKMRAQQEKQKKAPMYDRHCLYLSEQEIQEKLDNNVPFVIRQKIPSTQAVKFKDHIRGTVRFAAKTLDDQILLKSDGFPTYHLANVVDDHLMKISHVIRGEEWLPSTPKHILLYKAFGWDPPEFAHIPLLLNKDRSKLSKRQGDVSVEDYIDKGYLREAILNFIAFLGWHPGGEQENELFTLDELAEHFSLKKVHKAGAIFDIEKLDWFNWQWNRKKYHEQLREIAQTIDPKVDIGHPKKGEYTYRFEQEKNKKDFIKKRAALLINMCEDSLDTTYKGDEEKLNKALITVEEKLLQDPKKVNNYIAFYFTLDSYDTDLLTHERMKVDRSMAQNALQKVKKQFETMSSLDSETTVQEVLISLVQKMGVKNGQVLWPLRAALTGLQYSPGVFEVACVLGKDECLKRIDHALSKLEKE
ncbi:glutamate--tRNA ligase [Candidatus Peregrinibacteria bacterium]|nr:glutamate--tRNA ligase [Candidatus Peregrinibacteria bacterium]